MSSNSNSSVYITKDRISFFQDMYTYFPTIRRLIKNKGGQEEDAKDVFQDALIVLWEKLQQPDFELRAEVKTYLYGICKNLWNQKCKIQKHFVSLTLEKEEALLDVTEESPIDHRLLNILDQLSEACQKIFHGFYHLKLSMAQLAAQLGYASEQSAKTQKYKCIEKAREIALTQIKNA